MSRQNVAVRRNVAAVLRGKRGNVGVFEMARRLLYEGQEARETKGGYDMERLLWMKLELGNDQEIELLPGDPAPCRLIVRDKDGGSQCILNAHETLALAAALTQCAKEDHINCPLSFL